MINALMEKLKYESFEISLGQVFGSHFLANYAPKINVSLFPIGCVSVLISDNFNSVGINQVRDQICIEYKD